MQKKSHENLYFCAICYDLYCPVSELRQKPPPNLPLRGEEWDSEGLNELTS